MKTIKIITVLTAFFLFTFCKSDDDGVDIPLEISDCVIYTPTQASNLITANWSAANEVDDYVNEIIIPNDLGGGYVKVTVVQNDPDLRPWLIIDDDLGTGGAIVSGSSVGTNNELIREAYFSVHPGSTYSIRTYPFFNASNYPVNYTVEWEFFSRVDCWEQNDSKTTAKKVLLDEINEAYAIAGYISSSVSALDDQTYDWYKFNLTESSVVQAEILDMPNDMRIQLRLFKPDGSTVPIDFEWTSPDLLPNSNGRLSKITSTSAIAPGTYYIEWHGDFVQDRTSSNDLFPIPNHFNKTYKFRVTKI